MTRDDIICMGVRVGLIKSVKVEGRDGYVTPGLTSVEIVSDEVALEALERFVAAAVAAEREACAVLVQEISDVYKGPAIAAAIRARGASPQRCTACGYQHGHAIGCVNNPVDIAINARSAA